MHDPNDLYFSFSNALEAPCMFCGYNGELYWQKISHDATCVWRHVGGKDERMNQLKLMIPNALQQVYGSPKQES